MCDWGYQLQISCTTADDTTTPDKCTAIKMSCEKYIDDCNRNVVYGGFSAWLNAMLSCHECKNPINSLGVV